MADADVLAEIDKTTKRLADDLLTAAGNVMTDHVTGYKHGAMRDALVAFCEGAADRWREMAELWIAARKKDSKSRALRCKGAATGFDDVATLLRQLKFADDGERADAPAREPITAPLRDPFNYAEVQARYSGPGLTDGSEALTPSEPAADEAGGIPLLTEDQRAELGMQPLTAEQAETIAAAAQPSAEDTRAYLAGEIDTLPVPHGYVLRRGVAVPDEMLTDTEPSAADVIGAAQREAAGSLQEFATGGLVYGPTDIATELDTKMPLGDGANWAYNSEGVSTVESAQFPFSEPIGPGAPEVAPLTFAELQALPRDAMPEHLSWSQITSLEDCSASYAIERLGGHKGKPNWSTVGGRAVHKVIEIIERMADMGVQVPAEQIGQLWETSFTSEIASTVEESGVPSSAWRVPNRGLEGYDWWRVQGGEMVQRYVAARRHDHGSPVVEGAEILRVPHSADGATSIETVIEYEMIMDVDGVPVKLVIDQAWRLADGTIVIVDAKTGRTPGDSGQLGLYAHALLQALWDVEGGVTPLGAGKIFGTFYDARKGTYSEPIDLLERHPWEEYVYRVGAATERRNARYFAPRRSSFCNGCGVQALCPVGGKR